MRILLTLLLAVPLLSGCFGDKSMVAVLLADESEAAAAFNVDAFSERVEAACEDCEVTVYDAGGDADEQKAHARQVAAADAALVVIWPVEPEEAEGYSFDEIPVVSTVTLVPGADRFVGLSEPPASLPSAGAELEQARDIIAGKARTLTHVPAQGIAEQTADVSLALLADTPVDESVIHEGVRSWLFEATEVNLDNLTTVLVGQGVFTLEELCEGDTAKRCEELGFV